DGNAHTMVAVGADKKIQVWLVTGRQRFEIPVDQEGQMVINYLGPSELRSGETTVGRIYRFPRYSIADIIQGREDKAPPEAFRNKMVLVGAVAVGLSDLHKTPFDAVLSGVETHAMAIDNILRQNFVIEPWWVHWFTLANIILVGVLLIRLLPRLGAIR